MSLKRIGNGLAGLIGLGIIFIGARFLLAPEVAAAGFGLPASAAGDAGAYLSTKGVRDIASGLFVLALLATRQTRALGLVLLVASLIPLGDMAVVLARGGPPSIAFGVHGGTAITVLLDAYLLLEGDRRQGHLVPAPQLMH
jgi:hypothetical protein